MAKLRKRVWKTKKGDRIAWFVDVTHPHGGRLRRIFSSRREADDWRIEIEGKIKEGTFSTEAARATVKDVAGLYLVYCEARMRRRERMSEHMFDTYAGYIHNYICPDAEHHASIQKYKRVKFFEHGIGHIRVTALSARNVNEFRDHLRDAGLSVATTRKILATLKLVLAHAIGLDMIRHNVAQGIRVIARHDEINRKVVPPTKEAMKQLLAAAEGEFRVKLLVAAMTGVRASEMHALRWRHINLEKGEVKIETRVDRYGREDITKTAAGVRTIPLGVDVIRELHAWKSRTSYPAEDDLVFPNQWGRHSNHPNMIKRDFQPLFEKLARLHAENPAAHPPAPPRFNWHALRHFAISCWIDAELTPKTVQTFAGHSTLAVTMDRYGHLFKSDDHRIAMDAIARQFAAEEPARPAATQEATKEADGFDPQPSAHQVVLLRLN